MATLSVQGLRVEGEPGRLILTVDTLDVPSGQLVGVRGPSGAGKTTLIYALAGLVRPKAGTVAWNGRDIAPLDNAARTAFRRDCLGIVFQDFLLFEELTPLRNVTISRAYSGRDKRTRLQAHGAALLNRMGIEDAATRRVDTFSGGERQRISICRALADDPDIILADEPTASLDRASANRLIGDLVALARDGGKTLIAASHDPALHANLDRVIDIVDGKMVCDMLTSEPLAALHA